MAMSDLELLQLVDTLKDRQRGPQGEAGISIVEINQPNPDSFVITLSNGKTHRIGLVPGRDGETGPQGIRGERGAEGPAGRNGQPGAVGAPGRDGRDGTDGVSLDTAIVNTSGHLLLGLTDGAIIDVGRVLGPAGSTGAPGPSGLPGEPGADGAAVLSGPRAPQESDGAKGDHWIDISSAEFGFYKKSGNGWNKVANLRQPARDPRIGVAGVSGDGGGGNSGGTLQNTATLPLANPTRVGSVKGLPDTSGLKTQSDYNAWAHDALESLAAGGGGDVSDLEQRVELLEKALLPWVEFTEEHRSCHYSAGSNYTNASVRMNQYWSSSPAGEWTWAWMVKFAGSDEWTDVDDMEHDVAMSIGYDGVEAGTYLYLYPTGDTIPEIEVRLKVTDSLEGFETVEAWSEPFFPAPVWANQGTQSATAASAQPKKSGRGSTLAVQAEMNLHTHQP